MDTHDQIFAQDDRSLDELRDQATPMLIKYGIQRAGFFGSRARGDHSPDSDLDILIECPADRKFSLFELVELQDELTDVPGIQVQLAEYDSPNEHFLARALPDEVSILLCCRIKPTALDRLLDIEKGHCGDRRVLRRTH